MMMETALRMMLYGGVVVLVATDKPWWALLLWGVPAAVLILTLEPRPSRDSE